MTQYDLLVITGPTASGKTVLAASIAARLNGEIISADSRQVYRGMDIGTGKDLGDYDVDGVMIPVHLIDIEDPGNKYNVFRYQRDFLDAYNEIRNRKKFPVVCGGSGLYIDSIISGYRLIKVPPDPALRKKLEKKEMPELIEILKSLKKLHNITDIDSKKRIIRAIEIEKYSGQYPENRTTFPKIGSLIIGVKLDRELRRKRVSERLIKRLKNGMVEEVQNLIDSGVSREALIYYGLEYKYITDYLSGRMSYEEMYSGLETAIHQFAKRQMTWLRGMERKGVMIHWLDGNLPMEEKVRTILNLLNSKSEH
jgi:tRNA dimethylallyltransferase